MSPWALACEPDPLKLQAELPLCAEPDKAPRRKPWAWLLKHVFAHCAMPAYCFVARAMASTTIAA